MIDPDQIKINLIPDSQISHLEIENVSKIKSQNSFLKNSIIAIAIVAVAVSIRNYLINKNRNLNY